MPNPTEQLFSISAASVTIATPCSQLEDVPMRQTCRPRERDGEARKRECHLDVGLGSQLGQQSMVVA